MLGFTFVLYIWLGVHRCKMACDHLVLAQNSFTAFRGGACEYWLSQGFHLRTYYLGFHGRVFFLIDIWYNLIIIKFTSAEYVLMSNWHAYSHVYIVLSCYQTFVPFPKFPYAPLVYHFPTADLFPVIIVLELSFGHLLKILNHTVFPSAEVQGCATISSHISSFTPELHSMLWIYHSLTIHSSVEWHLSCF